MSYNFRPSYQKFLSKIMSKFSLLVNVLLSITLMMFYSCEDNDSIVGCEMLIMVDSMIHLQNFVQQN